jgi:hypothetical protein
MPSNAAVPAGFITFRNTFIASDSTSAKVLLEPQTPLGGSATSPTYFGGSTVLDLVASSTDGSNKDVILYTGEVATTVGASTGTTTTTTSTIVRSSGNFISDGWNPGDLVMVFNPPGTARQATDGVLGVVTTVAALTLTVSGTPFTALTLNTGVRICKVSQLFRDTVPLNAGNSASIPAKNLLTSKNSSSSIVTEKKLGSNELIIASMQSAVSALPAYVSIYGQAARY